MTIQVLMPALSPTMTDGKLARWLKREGEAVSSGDVIAEIETDKATMEVEAVDEGVIGRILVAEGSEGVPVNAPIALLLEEGEDAAALDAAGAAAAQAAAAEAMPSGAPAPGPAAAATAATPAPAPAAAPSSVPQPSTAGGGKDGRRVFASPLARRLAADGGLDLTRLAGSGPHGRIVKRDVEAALAEARAKPQAAAPAAEPPAAQATAPAPGAVSAAYDDVPHSTMRKVIARRLSESKRDIPHYYLTIECNLEAVLDLRGQLNARSPEGAGAFKLSLNDFIIRAVALALRAYPEANSAWTDEALRLYRTVDIAVAVATANGLITPVVRNADVKGLAAIAAEVRDVAARARAGKLKPEDYQGGTFTVSNLGMYGIREFSAIINPPQSCLLAVGAAEKRPIVKDGALAVATMSTCTLSADHRSVDGAKGAEFLAVFRRYIEDPLTMML
ncbi:MAG: pyruvate dehydrogenase complex dihydrolipoamide acetyltransferase [Rhodospirillales bacterium]|nr:pyruvate dehydrogenase complex dihydrolipoamide acetyltransferase [Rhodospirillales bacterium]